MEVRSRHFKSNVRDALANDTLQQALAKMRTGFVTRRSEAVDRLPEFDDLRDQARDIKNHTLEHLDLYYEAYEERVRERGGEVHWAADAAQANDIIAAICEAHGARSVTKGKSMIAEEIALNDHLEGLGLEVVETDLGEYIIQIRNEAPSHIIAPAVHLTRDQVEQSFRETHDELPPERNLDEASALIGEARQVLRQKYIEADVGITGANFLIAETGSSVIVTNEGNGDLTQILPRVHIVITSLEKMVPTLEDMSTILRVLARSATGQEFSSYTTLSTGPRRPGDPDGPEAYHVVVLDNGRSSMIGTDFQDMLRCIRCGACMNHCPVYHTVGGHSYGWVYPGPMGAVLTPTLIGVEEGGHLPNASTFCGRCEAVCPMRIPLPKMMRHWREREFERHLTPKTARAALAAWSWLARRPALYHLFSSIAVKALRIGAFGRGKLRSLPLARGWTDHRDMPAPAGHTFQELWRAGGDE